MSDLMNAPGLLEELKQQHQQFITQRDAAQNNLNQLIGAIYASDVIIKKYEDSLSPMAALECSVSHPLEIPVEPQEFE